MKKFLNLFAILSLSASTAAVISENMNNLSLTNNDLNSIDSNFSTTTLASKINLMVENKGKFQRNVLSRYPSKVGKPEKYNEDGNVDKFKEISAKNRNIYYGQKDIKVTEMDVNDFGYESKIDFLMNYSEVEVSYDFGYNFTNNGNKGWQQNSSGVDMGTPESASKYFSLKSGDAELLIVDAEFSHTSSSTHRIKMILNLQWINSHIFRISFTSQALLNYNKGSTYAHAAYTGFKFNEVIVT